MTNYENETLSLIKGDTPKQKFENMQKIRQLIEYIATPRHGSVQENWNIDDVVDYINQNNLI